MAEGISDGEKDLLMEEEQDQIDKELLPKERFMALLSKMNDNICALGVSLNKQQHKSIVSDRPSTSTEVSAKKAKISSLSAISKTRNTGTPEQHNPEHGTPEH